jgi:hypothetical protein
VIESDVQHSSHVEGVEDDVELAAFRWRGDGCVVDVGFCDDGAFSASAILDLINPTNPGPVQQRDCTGGCEPGQVYLLRSCSDTAVPISLPA